MQNKKVVGICALVSVIVGTANTIAKRKELPSTRFLIGSGVVFLILSAMADAGESMSELAKGLAMGVMTTVVLGEGGGVLSYLDGRGETNTQRRPTGQGDPQERTATDAGGTVHTVSIRDPRGGFRSDTPTPIPGLHR